MQSTNAIAGPSRLRKPAHPFVAVDNRPDSPDGLFRVVIISSGSVASVKIPDIVGALSKDPGVAVQVVATPASLHFYSQESVDQIVRSAFGLPQAVHGNGDDESIDAITPTQDVYAADQDLGVRVWTDADEWSDWKKVGDPILHIELRRWADLVVVAPCSADMLAKIAGGLCDNLATSLLRALSPGTPTILCPAMNTHMYQHALTADHLRVAQERLGYMISGPQGAGRLACGDEGPGKMTDWRDIVIMIQDFAAMFHQRLQNSDPPRRAITPPASRREGEDRPKTPPTPLVSPTYKRLMLLESEKLEAEQNRDSVPTESSDQPQQPTAGEAREGDGSTKGKKVDHPFQPLHAFLHQQPGLSIDPAVSRATGPSLPSFPEHMAKRRWGDTPDGPGSGDVRTNGNNGEQSKDQDGRVPENIRGQPYPQTYAVTHWRHLVDGLGGDGSYWKQKWWIG